MFKTLKWGSWVFIFLFLAWGIYRIYTAPKIPESDVVTTQGLHWHAHLSIEINGKDFEIPEGIGITGEMGSGGDPLAMHTHDTSGIIHLEREGLIRKEDLKIKNFFKVWDKDFSKDSILGNKADGNHSVKFLINGTPNEEFGNYKITNSGTFDAAELGKIDDIKIIYQ